jgi:hypothetical protein
MKIIGKELTKKLSKHLDMIENYLNSMNLNVIVMKTISKSVSGDWVEIVFLTDRYEKNSNGYTLVYNNTHRKETPVLSISSNDVFGEIEIYPVSIFTKSNGSGYVITGNLRESIIDYVKFGIEIEIRKLKWKRI